MAKPKAKQASKGFILDTNTDVTDASSTAIVVDRISSHPWALDQVITLEKKIFNKADSWAGILPQEVKRRNTTTLVAYENGAIPKVAGYVILTTNGLAVHVAKLAVREDCRRRGIALQLFRAALLIAVKERRVVCSTLHVSAENAPALALYKKIGYVSEAYLKDYYGPGRDAHKMMCELETSELFQAWLASGVVA